MEVFRVSAERYADKLTASGVSNRWNKPGEFVIYAGSSRSLSTLELVVHRSNIQPGLPYKMMVIYVPDTDVIIKTISTNDLPENWRTLAAYSQLQDIGSKWYGSQDALILKVPSVIIPQEYNFILNTSHPQFTANIQLISTEDYFWDERLQF